MSSICVFVAALFLTVQVVQTPERFRIGEATEAGDRFIATNRESVNITFHPVNDGQPVPIPLRFESTTEEQYTERITMVDARRKVLEFNRLFSRARERESEPLGAPRVRRMTYEGKAISLRATVNETRILSPVKLAAEDRSRLESKGSKSSFANAMPQNPLAVGETWKAELMDFPESIGAGKATLHGKVAEIVNYAGHRCLRLEMKVEMAGKMRGESTSTSSTMTGETYLSLDINRILKVTLNGPIAFDASDTRGNNKMEANGSGQVRFVISKQYLAVGGRPVSSAQSIPPRAANR